MDELQALETSQEPYQHYVLAHKIDIRSLNRRRPLAAGYIQWFFLPGTNGIKTAYSLTETFPNPWDTSCAKRCPKLRPRYTMTYSSTNTSILPAGR